MRIAFISTMASAAWGGSEELWTRTALEALKQGHEVYCSVNDWGALPPEIARLQEMGATLHLRPLYSPDIVIRIKRRLLSRLDGGKAMQRSLNKFRPDIVCVNQGGNFDLTEIHWLREYLLQCKASLGILCHNFNPGLLPSDKARQHGIAIFEKAKRVFFVSQEQAHVTQRQLAHELGHCLIIKNPVNVTRKPTISWPSAQQAQFAMVAALHVERKGHDIALEVLSQEKWKQRDWHLNIYGNGPDQIYIQDLAAMYGLTGRLTLHGVTSDVTKVWDENHLLLLPSRLEAAPLVVFEAMLCGRPVVATAVGTVPEWIIPHATGFVAPAATVSLFDHALEQAWQARAEWKQMGHKSYEWACANEDPAAATTFLQCLLSL